MYRCHNGQETQRNGSYGNRDLTCIMLYFPPCCLHDALRPNVSCPWIESIILVVWYKVLSVIPLPGGGFTINLNHNINDQSQRASDRQQQRWFKGNQLLGMSRLEMIWFRSMSSLSTHKTPELTSTRTVRVAAANRMVMRSIDMNKATLADPKRIQDSQKSWPITEYKS